MSLREATSNGRVMDVVPASADVIDAVSTGSIPLPDDAAERAGVEPVVIRQKVFPATRMTQEDAVDHMELVGHDFFLFIDAAPTAPRSSTAATAGTTASSARGVRRRAGGGARVADLNDG